MQAPQPISQDMIFNALYTAIELTDSVLQIWLTLTFAVIVSTYVAGKRFDRPVYLLVSGLYAIASAIQLVRFCTASYAAFFYKNWLIERGFEAWPVPNSVSVIIGANLWSSNVFYGRSTVSAGATIVSRLLAIFRNCSISGSRASTSTGSGTRKFCFSE